MTNTSKPVAKFTVGSITASVWRNEKDGQVPSFNTTIDNRYKQGDEWKTSSGFSKYDLINLAKAAMLAHSEVLKLSRSEGQEGRGEDAEAA